MQITRNTGSNNRFWFMDFITFAIPPTYALYTFTYLQDSTLTAYDLQTIFSQKILQLSMTITDFDDFLESLLSIV